ncbi:hypothetical protein DERP_002890, partial [Dermatophagoides pteronyssinus]
NLVMATKNRVIRREKKSGIAPLGSPPKKTKRSFQGFNIIAPSFYWIQFSFVFIIISHPKEE